MKMTKIDLISGILGAGKTTFLRQYARHLLAKGNHIAILENDFGAVNIDMAMLRDLQGDNCELGMIAGGCDPDCHRRRFKTQLIGMGMRHFDRILVEPSGIFDMDEFFDTLHEPPLDRWFEIGSVITIVSADTEEELPPQIEYLFGSEAACAGKILLSKLGEGTDPSVPEHILSHLNRALAAIRCDRTLTERELLAKPWASLTAEDFDALSCAGYRGSSYVKRFRPEDIRSGVHYFMHLCIPAVQIRPLIGEILADPACGHIFRLKGSLPLPDGSWCRINAMPEKTEISAARDGQAVLIVIGDALNREAIDSHLRAANTDPDYVSI